MARTTIPLDDKIEQQKQVVSKAKDKYDAAVAELEQLMRKRDEIRNKNSLRPLAQVHGPTMKSWHSFREKVLRNDPFSTTRVNFSGS